MHNSLKLSPTNTVSTITYYNGSDMADHLKQIETPTTSFCEQNN